MKVYQLIENDEFENISFSSDDERDRHIINKLKAINDEQEALRKKLRSMVDQGFLFPRKPRRKNYIQIDLNDEHTKGNKYWVKDTPDNRKRMDMFKRKYDRSLHARYEIFVLFDRYIKPRYHVAWHGKELIYVLNDDANNPPKA
jgi:hypothetical protein